MEIKVIRKYLKDAYTIGNLYVNGTWFCNTLEDKVRELPKENKIYGETAIPYGGYEVRMDIRSPKYTQKALTDIFYKKFDGYIPRLMKVPYFDAVLIHPGSTTADTLGCILVGENRIKGGLTKSRETFEKLWNILMEAHKNEDVIIIKIEKA